MFSNWHKDKKNPGLKRIGDTNGNTYLPLYLKRAITQIASCMNTPNFVPNELFTHKIAGQKGDSRITSKMSVFIKLLGRLCI